MDLAEQLYLQEQIMKLKDEIAEISADLETIEDYLNTMKSNIGKDIWKYTLSKQLQKKEEKERLLELLLILN